MDVIKHSNGKIGEHMKLALYLCQLKGSKDSMDVLVVSKSMEQSTEAYFAYTFISGANRKK
eukprot:5251616-Ditylum_brightwellii.AAC.1